MWVLLISASGCHTIKTKFNMTIFYNYRLNFVVISVFLYIIIKAAIFTV
jgi:hypothetical protein